MTRRCCSFSLLIFLAISHCTLFAQLQQTAKIIGQLRAPGGDFPSYAILIELRLHGTPLYSRYADAQGRFSFDGLVTGEYRVVVNCDLYYPVDESVVVNPEVSPYAMALITLRQRDTARTSDPMRTRAAGSNPNVVDSAEYNSRVSNEAIKEYAKGIDAEHKGRRNEAIAHYKAAVRIAPQYYPAHNNLGSEYLVNSDFVLARKEFEEVIRLNQSDAAGYFNLANVCLLVMQLPDAQQYLNEGMRRQPDSALGHFLLGSLDIRTGKYDQAEAALRQAIQLSPVMTQARLQLVNLLLQRGRKADAAAQLHEFISAFPDSSFTPKARALLQKLESSANAQVPN